MGIRVSVLRDDYDSTANVFHGKGHVTVTNIDGPFEPTEDAPAAVLTTRMGNAIVVPEHAPVGKVGPMFGGTFAHTSDSRFGKAVKFYGAVAIHDRFE